MQSALVWKGWAQMPLIFRITPEQGIACQGKLFFRASLALSPGAFWLHLQHHGYSSSGLKPF